MSESTLEAPSAVGTAAPDTIPGPEPAPWTLRAFTRRHPWWSATVVLLVISGALILWARTRPSYDAFGWLVWGYQTLHGSLNLGGAPSWKPLTYVFTVPYALFGHYQLWLWMLTLVTVSLAGSVFAGRIAYRLTLGHGERVDVLGMAPRTAAWAAAVFAGLGLLGLEDYLHYILSAQSDPMIVTWTLAGIDMYLIGRNRSAYLFFLLAGLGRPEGWPFLFLFSVYAWRKVPSMRWLIAAGWVLNLFMWFGVPTITNDRPFVSAELAQNSPRELHQNQITGTIGRFTELQYLPMWIAALLTTAWAAARRDIVSLCLAAGAVLWVIVEIAFALHGWPGLSRYMFEPGALAVILAAIGVGWVLLETPRLRRGLPRWSGIPIVVVLLATLVPGALGRLRTEHRDLRHERTRSSQISLLKSTIDSLGGVAHVRACGEPVTIVEYASTLAWLTHLDVGSVGYLPSVEMHRTYPIVIFGSNPHGGWDVRTWHTRPSQVAACSGLNADYTTGDEVIPVG